MDANGDILLLHASQNKRPLVLPWLDDFGCCQFLGFQLRGWYVIHKQQLFASKEHQSNRMVVVGGGRYLIVAFPFNSWHFVSIQRTGFNYLHTHVLSSIVD